MYSFIYYFNCLANDVIICDKSKDLDLKIVIFG